MSLDITHPRVEEYLFSLWEEDDPVLLEMEDRARGTEFPIVDRLVGRLLFILTSLKSPELIVEVGSGYGYSAYWFARAMHGKGRIVLTDYKQENLDYARSAFERGGLTAKAEYVAGDAIETATKYGDIDILFLDLEKSRYKEAAEAILPNLAPGALVIADNTLWYGRVAEEGSDEPQTKGIRAFNEYMFSQSGFMTSIVPLRDGVLIAKKL